MSEFSVFIIVVFAFIFGLLNQFTPSGEALTIILKATHRCPKCNLPLEKNQYCNFCQFCGQELDWGCKS